MNRLLMITATLSLMPVASLAQDEFHAGTVIPAYGKVATIESDLAIPKRAKFRVVYDVATAGGDGINRGFVTPARFINMHAEAGVKPENIRLAIIIHGGAVHDVTQITKAGATNPNTGLIAALLENGVEIFVCGQSAVYNGVDKEDLLPGVKMSLSAMTAHALYQQKGYTLNPF